MTSVVALAVAVPALLLPVDRFANQEAALDAFSFIPLWQLRELTSTGVMQAGYGLAIGVVVILAVVVPRKTRLVLVGVVGTLLVAASAVSSFEIQQLARDDRTWVFSTAEPRWIDDVAEGPVTYLRGETELSAALWKTLYWNERIDRVLRLGDAPPAGPAPERPVAQRFDGVLVDTNGERLGGGYVAAPSSIVLAGTLLASYGPATDMSGTALWMADTPLRVRWRTEGVQQNGDILGTALVQVLGCGPGHLSLTLLGKQRLPVHISVNGGRALTIPLTVGSAWSGDVPAPTVTDGTGICYYEIRSSGLVGSTRIEFIRD